MTEKLTLSEAAVADIQDIFEYGLRTFGEVAAVDFQVGLKEQLQNLCTFPEAYAEDVNLSPPGRVAPFGPYVILYRYDADGVFIGRIRHHSEDWRKTSASYNEHTDQLKLDCANVRVRMISGCVSHQAGRGSLFYGQVNAKNRFGGYSGWRSFACFADEREAGIQFIDSCVYEVDGQRIYLC